MIYPKINSKNATTAEKTVEFDNMTKDDIAQHERYTKLLDDVLYAVAIFYSRHMATYLTACGQPISITIISLTLLAMLSVLQGWVERQWSEFHGFHTLWTDILKAWLSTATRTLSFLIVAIFIDIIEKKITTTEHTVIDVFIQPFLYLFILISMVKYVTCLSIEAYRHHHTDMCTT
jgi:hypothetical protein